MPTDKDKLEHRNACCQTKSNANCVHSGTYVSTVDPCDVDGHHILVSIFHLMGLGCRSESTPNLVAYCGFNMFKSKVLPVQTLMHGHHNQLIQSRSAASFWLSASYIIIIIIIGASQDLIAQLY